MAKQKQDNKTVNIELLILRDKIEELINTYEDVDHCLHKTIIKDLKELLGDCFTPQHQEKIK